MSTTAVIVNGLPGAGKTTLCAGLGRELGLPVVAKDAIKEALAETVATTLPTTRLGAIASDTLWAMAALLDEPLIIESFWLTGRDDAYFSAGVGTAGIRNGLEVWCEAPLDVMRERFRTRPRHFAHQDATRLDEWDHHATHAAPISTFPLIRVDTGGPVDFGRLARAIRRILPL